MTRPPPVNYSPGPGSDYNSNPYPGPSSNLLDMNYGSNPNPNYMQQNMAPAVPPGPRYSNPNYKPINQSQNYPNYPTNTSNNQPNNNPANISPPISYTASQAPTSYPNHQSAPPRLKPPHLSYPESQKLSTSKTYNPNLQFSQNYVKNTVASSIGINDFDISDAAADYLAKDLNFTIKNFLQTASKISRHSLTTHLSTNNLSLAINKHHPSNKKNLGGYTGLNYSNPHRKNLSQLGLDNGEESGKDKEIIFSAGRPKFKNIRHGGNHKMNVHVLVEGWSNLF